MTEPEATQQDTELNPEAPEVPDETAGFNEEQAEEALAADYQTRLAEFDEVESVPVVSVPVPSSELSESDLKVQGPGGQSG